MGPKYEFTGETKQWGNSTLHRIRRLSDSKLGGWIEKEDNLSQEGTCWVDDNAMVAENAQVSDNAEVVENAQVFGNAQVYGNAQVRDNALVYSNTKVYENTVIYDEAQVFGNAQVYGYAQVYGNALLRGNAQVYEHAQVYSYAYVYDNAQVYDNAKVYDNTAVHDDARVYGNAEVYGGVQVYGSAYVYGNAKVFGNAEISKGCISSGEYGSTSNINVKNEESEVIKAFVYQIDDSSKLDIRTNYDSVNAFFDDYSDDSYIEHECLTIIAVDTKIPILKLEKAQVKNKNVFKFIVDITNEEDDADYSVKSIIDSKDKFEQLLHLTIESLHSYPQFSKYVEELENCL